MKLYKIILQIVAMFVFAGTVLFPETQEVDGVIYKILEISYQGKNSTLSPEANSINNLCIFG